MAVMLNNILKYSSGSQTFSDVTKTDYPWAYGAISALHKQGILTGYSDNTFKPQQNITRAELVALTSRLDPALLRAF